MSKQEVARVAKLEWMDEWEEFDIMHSHYFVSIAEKHKPGTGEDKGLSFELLK